MEDIAMKSFSLLAALQVGFALAASSLFLAPAPAAAEDNSVIDFSKTDPAMEAAKAKARASIATFWKAHAAPQANETGFALKVGFPTHGASTAHSRGARPAPRTRWCGTRCGYARSWCPGCADARPSWWQAGHSMCRWNPSDPPFRERP